MSKQYLKKLKGTDTPIATRYKPAFSDSEYTGFGELYRNGKWYKDVAVFADDFSTDTSASWNGYDCTLSIENGKLIIDDPNTYGLAGISVTLIQGKKYLIKKSYTQYMFLGANFGDRSNGGNSYGEYNNVSDTVITAPTTTVYFNIGFYNTTAGNTVDYFAIIPLNDDGSIDISNATELTTPQTYLPIECDVDEQGNLLNVDRMDFPTLVEDYVYAKNVKCDEANFVNGWKSEGMDAYACRAWVNFDGTTVAIRESGNVSSITDNGTGNYTINFTTAMPDIDYAFNASHTSYPGVIGWTFYSPVSESKLNVYTYGNSSYTSAVDPSIVTATVFH